VLPEGLMLIVMIPVGTNCEQVRCGWKCLAVQWIWKIPIWLLRILNLTWNM